MTSAFDQENLEALSEPPFVGKEREDLVTLMASAFATVARAGEPRWVSLSAPMGWGKTRIVRELYGRLARNQVAPEYWPIDLLAARPGQNLLSERKRVSGPFSHTPGSALSFFWFGVQCGQSGGAPLSALANSMGQLSAHADYLEFEWLRRAKFAQKAAHVLKGVGGETSTEVGTSVAAEIVKGGTGIEPSGLGLAWWLTKRLALAVSRKGHLDSLHNSNQPIEDSGTVIADECAAIFERLSNVGLPVVIAVEDAHFIDESTARLLHVLMGKSAPILVVTTQTEDKTSEYLKNAMASREDRVICVRPASADRSALDRSAAIRPLKAGDLGVIVRHWFPSVDDRTERALTRRFTTPLALHLFCTLPRNTEMRSGRRRTLTHAEIAKSPRTVRDLYRTMWQALDERTRRAIHIAVRLTPYGLDREFGVEKSWDPILIGRVMANSGLYDAAQLASRISQPCPGWIETRGKYTQLLEVDQFWIAEEDDDLVHPEELHSLHRCLELQLIANAPPAEFSVDESTWMWARSALALAASGSAEEPEQLLLGGMIVGTELTRFDQSPSHALSVIEFVRNNLSEDNPNFALSMLLSGRALLSFGKFEEANLSLEEARTRLDNYRGKFDTTKILIRLDLATAKTYLGIHERAIGELQQLVRDASDAGERKDIIWAARVALADAFEAAGNLDAAERELASLRDELEDENSFDPVIQASVRGNLAGVTYQLGYRRRATEIWEVLITELSDKVGQDHPLTLTQRSNRAAAHATEGPRAANESVAELRTLAELRAELFGATHPATLSTRGNLADALHEAGEEALALNEYEQLVRDSISALGESNPIVLSRRNNLAISYHDNGRLARAIQELQDVLIRLGSVMGPNHPRTIRTRESLSAMLAQREEVRRAGVTAFGTKR